MKRLRQVPRTRGNRGRLKHARFPDDGVRLVSLSACFSSCNGLNDRPSMISHAVHVLDARLSGQKIPASGKNHCSALPYLAKTQLVKVVGLRSNSHADKVGAKLKGHCTPLLKARVRQNSKRRPKLCRHSKSPRTSVSLLNQAERCQGTHEHE
jgi:hypothetical protein